MGEKDLMEKKLEDYNDVFADIFNTLLFGQQKLAPEHLENGPTHSLYKAASGDLREQGRDVAKEYRSEAQFVIASFAIENQSGYDAAMPVRIMGYDYTEITVHSVPVTFVNPLKICSANGFTHP